MIDQSDNLSSCSARYDDKKSTIAATATAAAATAAAAEYGKEWRCPHCTLISSTTNITCETCDNTKDTKGTVRHNRITGRNLF